VCAVVSVNLLVVDWADDKQTKKKEAE